MGTPLRARPRQRRREAGAGERALKFAEDNPRFTYTAPLLSALVTRTGGDIGLRIADFILREYPQTQYAVVATHAREAMMRQKSGANRKVSPRATGPAALRSTAASETPRPAETSTAFMVGGEVSAPIVISRANAVITKDMKCRGLVMIAAIIDTAGRPTHIVDLSRSPDAFTHAHAIALQSWRFRPATRRGEPVPVHFNLTIQLRCV